MSGFTGDQIVEIVSMILAGVALAFLVEAHIDRTDEKIRRIAAEERAKTYKARAEDAEAILRNTATPDFERHTDQAREVAEPTPGLRVIQ